MKRSAKLPGYPVSGIAALAVALIAAAQAATAMLPAPSPASAADPDPRTPICREALDPDAAQEKVHIHCALEYGRFAPETEADSSAKKNTVRVAAYNIERGMSVDKQIYLLRKHPDFRDTGIILLSEADRGCSRTDYRNITRDIAGALEMNYVYGVEYIELPRKTSKPVNKNETVCEHGNAVLSRWPIAGAEEIRHEKTAYSYIPPGPERDDKEPRLGGGMAVAADIMTAGGPVRVYSIHFDTSRISGHDVQESQAREIVEHAAGVSYPVVIGGDFNTVTYISDIRDGGRTDPATAYLLDSGFTDTHSMLPVGGRYTSGMSYGVKVIIDIIFVRGAAAVESGKCPLKTCGKLSDHLPVWTVIRWGDG